jgi:hypothetical protein
MKKQVSILSLLILVFCLNNAKGQLNNFDLSKYKTADYARQMLTLSGFVSGSYSENNSEGYDYYNKNFQPNFDIQYLLVKNTRKVQQKINAGLTLMPSAYSYHSSSSSLNNFYSRSREDRSNGSFYFDSENRFYFKTNQFFEIRPGGNLIAYYRKTEMKNVNNPNTNEQSDSRRSLDGYFTVPIGVGFGRLENIEDARMAILVLEDLYKNNKISKAINDEDILLFAEKITQLRNMRHFDARKRRIYEIQAVDSFLRNNAFSQSQDAAYFGSLYDNWEYANNPYRLSGYRLTIGVDPNLEYSINNYLLVRKNYDFSKGAGVFIRGELEKPLSLKWQQSLWFTGGYSITQTESVSKYPNSIENKSTVDNSRVYLRGSVGMGYYPDTRSYFRISLDPAVWKTWHNYDFSSNSENSEDLTFNIYLNLNGYLYVSERFNVNYTISTSYNGVDFEHSSLTKNHNFATSFNVSCSYSIF